MKIEFKFTEDNRLKTVFIDTEKLEATLSEPKTLRLLPLNMVDLAYSYLGEWTVKSINVLRKWYYGSENLNAWGALFVCWLARQCGVDNQIIPTDNSTDIYLNLKGLQQIIDRENYKSVAPGDLIFIRKEATNTIANVGIITSVESGNYHFIKSNGIDKVEELWLPYTSPTVYAIGEIHYLNVFKEE